MAKKPMSARSEAAEATMPVPHPLPAEPTPARSESTPAIDQIIPDGSDPKGTVVEDMPATIGDAEPSPAEEPSPVTSLYGIIDLVKGRGLAGWLRIIGDPAAVRVFLLRDFRELEIPIVRSSSAEDIWLFSLTLPVALTARELLMGKAAVVARCDGLEHKLGLWDPIRIAGEIGGYDLTMLSRLRHALPRGILGSLNRDPTLDES